MTRRLSRRSIFKGKESVLEAARLEAAGGVDLEAWAEKVKNMIPGEVVALYLAGLGVVPKDQLYGMVGWGIFCLIAVVIQFARQTRKDPETGEELGPDWWHVAISAVSFLVWMYTLGGPFEALGLHIGWLSFLIMLGWTFIISPLYQGPEKPPGS